MEDIDKEDYRKPSGDEGEVVFSQQEKVAATMGPYGLTVDRQNENEWLDDTEPYHRARPRMMQERRPMMVVDSVLVATVGTTGQYMGFHDTPAPTLPPEQQIRQEGEIRTPPRREPRRDGGQRPKEFRLPMGGAALAPGSFADQGTEAAGRNRQSDEWSPVIALENTVLRMQRDLEDLQAENRFLRTPKPPAVAPHVRQAALTTTKVPWLNGSTSWEQYQQVFDAIVLSNGWGDATAALVTFAFTR